MKAKTKPSKKPKPSKAVSLKDILKVVLAPHVASTGVAVAIYGNDKIVYEGDLAVVDRWALLEGLSGLFGVGIQVVKIVDRSVVWQSANAASAAPLKKTKPSADKVVAGAIVPKKGRTKKSPRAAASAQPKASSPIAKKAKASATGAGRPGKTKIRTTAADILAVREAKAKKHLAVVAAAAPQIAAPDLSAKKELTKKAVKKKKPVRGTFEAPIRESNTQKTKRA